MNRPDPRDLTLDALFAQPDSLLVWAEEADGRRLPYVLIDGEGRIFGFNGHVDLGTGVRTSLAQIVAEELDAAPGQTVMILGDTARTPNQGATIASDTIQTTAVPLRAAAAQARGALLARAAEIFQTRPDQLSIAQGKITTGDGTGPADFGQVLAGSQIRLELDRQYPVKDARAYTIVGKPVPRVDIPAKAVGDLTFVHDMRMPGMLHGRVVRPPYAGQDAGPFVGTSLIGVDRQSISHLPGLVDVVVQGDFIGVIAEREEIAELAMRLLQTHWKPVPGLRPMDDLAQAIIINPTQPRTLQEKGDIEKALDNASTPLDRTYVWPYQMHASIGPSCAVADWREGMLRVWSGTQNPHPMRADLAKLLDLRAEQVDIVRMEAAGCYGRNGADDVTADAALLARAVGRPVRVQLTREQEHLWEPKGTGQLMEVKGGLDAEGAAIAYDYSSRYPSNLAPTLALLLTGKVSNQADVIEMGDRTSVSPYDIPNMRVVIHDTAPIVRASWLRGVSALPNSFAHESWIDEAAAIAGVDPVEYRLRYMTDRRGIAIVEATAERAGWTPHTRPQTLARDGDWLHGRGFAYALYVHSKFPGYGAAWAAWVADVSVNAVSGEVRVDKITVGHDAGLMINPDGVQHQIHGNVVQSLSRSLKEQVRFDERGVVSAEWGGYPLLSFTELPEVDVLMLPRPDEPPLGAGESASVPSAAAIANALYDATGIRFREPPFTAEKIRAALIEKGILPPPSPPTTPTREAGTVRVRRAMKGLTIGLGSGMAAGLAIALPWRVPIAPSPSPPSGFYSTDMIERGRLVAAAGDCAVCHTAPGGQTNAGGHALETPFGTIYSTNITPDPVHGLGQWSLSAFIRAMREGISRDGHHLYPAFPYTSFARIDDADLEALYAYLMSQPPVDNAPPVTKLAFPFNIRATMAGWNAAFHDPRPWRDEPSRSLEWNRGGYLVEGAGHCGACHTPRNLAGAEMKGDARFTGAIIDGWWAPSLNALGQKGPVPWSELQFYVYLRTGHSTHHGVAGGPMAPVIAELQKLPDSDIHAMARYLASMGHESVTPDIEAALASQAEARAEAQGALLKGSAANGFEAACAVCHSSTVVPFATLRPSLGINSAVYAPIPDNLIRTILDGADEATFPTRGVMPAFRDAMNDAQIAELVRYVRARFAAGEPAWQDVGAAVRRIRAKGWAPTRADR